MRISTVPCSTIFRCLPLLAACLALPAQAELLDEAEIAEVLRKPNIGLYKGYAEFKMAHYAEAKQIWTALAERGVGEAWFNLGILAEDGLGEPKDAAEARRRYEKGAEAGSRNSALQLAALLQGNRLGAPDLAAARHWLKRAAELGDEGAAAQLAALDGKADVKPADSRLAGSKPTANCRRRPPPIGPSPRPAMPAA
jgi:hypothetical protein